MINRASSNARSYAADFRFSFIAVELLHGNRSRAQFGEVQQHPATPIVEPATPAELLHYIQRTGQYPVQEVIAIVDLVCGVETLLVYHVSSNMTGEFKLTLQGKRIGCALPVLLDQSLVHEPWQLQTRTVRSTVRGG